jgi:hypothetical protein
MSHATTNPDWTGKVSGACAACSFLTPRFATREIHIGFGLCTGSAAAAGCLECNDHIMHSLVALGFLCDEFNLRLCGVCGCKNGGAHDQNFSTAQ